MDRSDLAPPAYIGALRGLERIHRMTGGIRYFWPHIREAVRERNGRTLRILDIATGGGDVLQSLAQMAEQCGLALSLSGCDINARAVEYARGRARDLRTSAEFFQWDVVKNGIPANFDIILCSLFLHHLEDEQAENLLAGLQRHAGHSALVLDLTRNWPGYALAYFGCRLTIPSPVIHIDAPLSVMSAFTIPEAHALARRAGLADYRIEPRFPYRFLLKIGRAR